MFSKAKLAIDTIGPESLYVMEKSRSAIFKNPGVDTNLAKTLLQSHKEKFQKLKSIIDQSPIYNDSYIDYEFKTMFYAIDKLLLAIENISNENDEFEAVIFQSHFCKQDDTIRRIIEEVENN